jgi:hypothetical protein
MASCLFDNDNSVCSQLRDARSVTSGAAPLCRPLGPLSFVRLGMHDPTRCSRDPLCTRHGWAHSRRPPDQLGGEHQGGRRRECTPAAVQPCRSAARGGRRPARLAAWARLWLRAGPVRRACEETSHPLAPSPRPSFSRPPTPFATSPLAPSLIRPRPPSLPRYLDRLLPPSAPSPLRPLRPPSLPPSPPRSHPRSLATSLARRDRPRAYHPRLLLRRPRRRVHLVYRQLRTTLC